MSDFNDRFRMEDAEESETGSRTGLVIAGAVVALLAVMLVFVVIANQGDDDPEAGPTGKPTPSAPATTLADNSDESVCGLAGHEETGALTEPPAGVTWDLVGAVAIPKSAEAGPGSVEDSGVRSCYARTPEGALLAAANSFAWAETLKTDPEAVIERSVAAGPGYDAALELAASGEAAGDDSGSETFLQIRGFQLDSYSDDNALVDIALQASTGQYVHMSLEVVWEKGDWRIRLLPDGSPATATQLPDLTGYVSWAGA